MVRFGLIQLSALVLSLIAFLIYHIIFRLYQTVLSKHLAVHNLVHCLVYYSLLFPMFIDKVSNQTKSILAYAMLGVILSCVVINWLYIVVFLIKSIY